MIRASHTTCQHRTVKTVCGFGMAVATMRSWRSSVTVRGVEAARSAPAEGEKAAGEPEELARTASGSAMRASMAAGRR